LLSDLRRKTAEPIALASGTGVRTLQLLLSQHAWDSSLARKILQQHVAALLPSLPNVQIPIRVGFRRWNVEHAIPVSKQEIGLKHFEGQNYTALMRHLTMCVAMMVFGSEQAPPGAWGKNPEATTEQVCAGLVVVLRMWLERMRASSALSYTAEVIQYHQRCNRAARESRQRRNVGLPDNPQTRRRRRRRRHQSNATVNSS
jgi:hypothetical protein